MGTGLRTGQASLPGVVVSRGAGAHSQGPSVAAATVPRCLGDSSPTLGGSELVFPHCYRRYV